ELIVDGETGVLFPADDPAGIAQSLSQMLDHRHAWPAMRERAQAFIVNERDWQINSRRYQAVYHRLLGRPTDRSPESAAWMPLNKGVHARQGGPR
ncbi:glycosyltransferase WbuB, partial [bacterium]|nr:glycosyltransferase WbuB [bacterium]